MAEMTKMPTRAWVEEQMKIARERNERPDFRNLDFSGLNLSNLDMSDAILDGATLIGTNLRRTCLDRVSASFADFRNADMSSVAAHDADFDFSNFRGAIMTCMSAHRALFAEADMRDVKAIYANFYQADMSQVDARGANLRNAQTRGTAFYGAVLLDAVLNNNIHHAGLHRAHIDALTVPGLPLLFLATPAGWRVCIGYWKGSIDEFRTLIDSGDWQDALGEENSSLGPVLTAAADMCDAFAATRPDAVARARGAAKKWGHGA